MCPGHLAWAARAAATRETAEMSADHRATTANMSMTGHSTVVKKAHNEKDMDFCAGKLKLSGVGEARPKMQTTQSNIFISIL